MIFAINKFIFCYHQTTKSRTTVKKFACVFEMTWPNINWGPKHKFDYHSCFNKPTLKPLAIKMWTRTFWLAKHRAVARPLDPTIWGHTITTTWGNWWEFLGCNLEIFDTSINHKIHTISFSFLNYILMGHGITSHIIPNRLTTRKSRFYNHK